MFVVRIPLISHYLIFTYTIFGLFLLSSFWQFLAVTSWKVFAQLANEFLIYANWIWVGLEAFRAHVIHKDKPNAFNNNLVCSYLFVFCFSKRFCFFFFLCLLIKYTCYLDSVIDFMICVCWKMDFYFFWFNISKQRLLMTVIPVLGFGVWMLNLLAWLILIGLK